jgi:PadR family transcriptional regulator PadR
MNSGSAESRGLFPGALEMMILQVLRGQPSHGYALVQHIRTRSKDLLQVEEGSLYPALQRMLKAGLVKARWEVSPTGRRVRTYELTTRGAKHLDRQLSDFERMLEGINLVLAPVKP